MRRTRVLLAAGFACAIAAVLHGQEPAAPTARPTVPPSPPPDPAIKSLVERLDLEKYKATIKGLTQFGDRRQGTSRNRGAIDWIEQQLKSDGCTNTERVKYEYARRQVNAPPAQGRGGRSGAANPRNGSGGSVIFGTRARTGVNMDPNAQPDETIRKTDTEPDEPGPREEVFC